MGQDGENREGRRGGVSYRDFELEARHRFDAEVASATRHENRLALKALIPVLIVVILICIRLLGF